MWNNFRKYKINTCFAICLPSYEKSIYLNTINLIKYAYKNRKMMYKNSLLSPFQRP